MHRFKTRAEAVEAGYRSPVKGQDKDVSGPGSYGYEFEDEHGNRTVAVLLDEEQNKKGEKGAVAIMFPPSS